MDGLSDDLMTAARFMLEDGFSLDDGEAVRVGMRLAKLAGMVEVIECEEPSAESKR